MADVMEKIREQIPESGEDDQVGQLSLDKCEIGKISEQLQKKLESYNNLEVLSMNECELVSLEGLPSLPKLVRLELIDNKITGQQLKHLLRFPALQSLSLGGNLIKSLADLDVLTQLPELYQLDFLNNEVATEPSYREHLFKNNRKLGILDNIDENGVEVEYCDEDEEDEEEDDDENEYEEDDEDEQGNLLAKRQYINNAVKANVESDDDDDEEDEEDEDDDEEDEEEDEIPVRKSGNVVEEDQGSDDYDVSDDDDEEDDDEEEEEDDDDENAETIEANSTNKKKFKPN